jgi:transcription elongation factor GreA
MVCAVNDNAMTAEGLEALRAELEELETTGREQIASQIKTAREWGDLKENAEYHAAKEAQAHLETRILKLRERVLGAQVVEVEKTGVVGFGSVVAIEDEASGKTLNYTLVNSTEASPSEGKLSMDSPVASALQGKSVGDTATVATPRGQRKFRVLSVD